MSSCTGASSRYASFFDIDWMPVKAELANKVLLPLLGDQYGVVLDRGELRMQLSDGRFTIHYYDTVLPVAPRTYVQILGHRLDQLEAALGPENRALLELKAIYELLLTIPRRTETNLERLAARYREAEIAVQKFAGLLETSGDVRDFITENVRIFNGTPGDPRSFDLLDELLHDQVYRLAYWRVAERKSTIDASSISTSSRPSGRKIHGFSRRHTASFWVSSARASSLGSESTTPTDSTPLASTSAVCSAPAISRSCVARSPPKRPRLDRLA
jgi:hypothetical protein